MINAQNEAVAVAIAPASVATTAATATTVDTLGYDYASFDIVLGAAATNPSVLKLLEGTTTSPATDVTAFVGDTAFTIPAADAGAAQVVRFNVDLRKRQRYLKLALTTGATQLVAATCRLSRAKDTTAAAATYSGVVTG
jgi:hypothetical protein